MKVREKVSEPEAIPFRAENELIIFLSSIRHNRARTKLETSGYLTEVERIDLLCRDGTGNLVVIELNKFKEGDRTRGSC